MAVASRVRFVLVTIACCILPAINAEANETDRLVAQRLQFLQQQMATLTGKVEISDLSWELLAKGVDPEDIELARRKAMKVGSNNQKLVFYEEILRLTCQRERQGQKESNERDVLANENCQLKKQIAAIEQENTRHRQRELEFLQKERQFDEARRQFDEERAIYEQRIEAIKQGNVIQGGYWRGPGYQEQGKTPSVRPVYRKTTWHWRKYVIEDVFANREQVCASARSSGEVATPRW